MNTLQSRIVSTWFYNCRTISTNRLFRERRAIARARAHVQAHLEMSRRVKNCPPNKQQITHLDCFYFYKPNGKKENIN